MTTDRKTKPSRAEALARQLAARLTAVVEEEKAEAEVSAVVKGLSPLPPGTPVLADNKSAPELFSLSQSTLEKLRRRYPDFPAKQAGDKVLYNVFRVWQWFDQYPERVIELQ